MMDALQALVADDPQTTGSNPVAEIDVFTRLERGVEPAHRLECRSRNRHVAAAEPAGVMLSARRAAKMAVRPLYPRAVNRRLIQGTDDGGVRQVQAFERGVDPARGDFVVRVDEREDVRLGVVGALIAKLRDARVL